jgi:plastocyanin domain-containing protein
MKTAVLFALALAPVLAGAASADTAKSKDPARIEITVTKRGFEPENISVPSNKLLTLVFTRKTDATCAKKVVVKLGDDKKVEVALPLDTAVEVPVTFAKAGKLTYACTMDMIKGTIQVQ